MKNDLKKNLSGLTFKEKADYIWEYYKLHIISVAILLFFIGSIINSTFINPPKKPYVHVAFYGNYVLTEALDSITKELTDILVEDKEKFAAYTSNFYELENDPQASMVIAQKFFAMLSVKELDLIFTDEPNFIGLTDQGNFLPLDDVLKQYNLEFPKEDLFVHTSKETDVEAVYGVKVESSAFLKKYGINTNNCYLGIVVNSQTVEHAVEGIKLLSAK